MRVRSRRAHTLPGPVGRFVRAGEETDIEAEHFDPDNHESLEPPDQPEPAAEPEQPPEEQLQ